MVEINGAILRHIEQSFVQSCLLNEGNIKIKSNLGENLYRDKQGLLRIGTITETYSRNI